MQVRVDLDDTFRLIGTQEELRDLFAPIESADEALSYALLATGYSAKYEPKDYRLAVQANCDPGPEYYHYYTDVLEDTHVAQVENGYQINLFFGKELGCEPHPVWSVQVKVTDDGTIIELQESTLYEEDMTYEGGMSCSVEFAVCCID